MNFSKVIGAVVAGLDGAAVRFAVIGGFAMGLRGVQRATMDLDFILMLEDLEKADAVLTRLGYRRAFHSENVSHYLAEAREWGRIDILHAFRGPSLGMLQRADRINLDDEVRLPVVQIVDLIGLKVQALVNDPERTANDWADIRMLLQAAGTQGEPLDWELLTDYLRVFRMENRLPELQAIYGQADRD